MPAILKGLRRGECVGTIDADDRRECRIKSSWLPTHNADIFPPMREMRLSRWLGLIALVAIARAGDSDSSSQPPHVSDAKLLVANVAPEDNDYDHKSCYIRWKGESGAEKFENHTDCSDFLNLLLEHSYHFTPEMYKEWTGHKRPTAAEWHDAVLAGKGMDVVDSFSDAKVGDYLIVKYPPGGANTGHVMLICNPPHQRRASRPIVDGTDQWDVPVIDSSESGHGKQDTRRKPEGGFYRGVGQGTMRIYTSGDGKVAGYTWSDEGVSTYRTKPDYDLLVGRLNSIPK
jgi:hypothetical protein